MAGRLRSGGMAGVFWPGLLLVLVLGFALHAVVRGLGPLWDASVSASRFYHGTDLLATGAVHAHMVAGGVLTLLVPVQVIARLRRRVPSLHRRIGYLAGGLSLVKALCGLVYILRQGSIGGTPMSAGFAVYGVLLGLAGVQAMRLARRRDPRHRDWALRLVVLALGSWIYRLHYGLWEIATGGLWSAPDFTGPFDRVQVVAFYLPYLLVLELALRRRPPPRDLFAAR